jgi:hypothetical protein
MKQIAQIPDKDSNIFSFRIAANIEYPKYP